MVIKLGFIVSTVITIVKVIAILIWVIIKKKK